MKIFAMLLLLAAVGSAVSRRSMKVDELAASFAAGVLLAVAALTGGA